MPPVLIELDDKKTRRRLLHTTLHYTVLCDGILRRTYCNAHMTNDCVIMQLVILHGRHVHLTRVFQHLHERIT